MDRAAAVHGRIPQATIDQSSRAAGGAMPARSMPPIGDTAPHWEYMTELAGRLDPEAMTGASAEANLNRYPPIHGAARRARHPFSIIVKGRGPKTDADDPDPWWPGRP